MKIRNSSVAITTGFALFAMFFGAGNMIFPLQIGVISGQQLTYAVVAFLISGVGVPLLGLFAVSLYEGDYWEFFRQLGKIPAFLIITFLVLILGPLFLVPRTQILTYHTLLPYLPYPFNNVYMFDAFYFILIFALTFHHSRIVDIIGWLLSPIKLIAFFTLIIVALYTAVPFIHTTQTPLQVFNTSLTMGYGTMDLLAAIFFCTVAYTHIVNKCKKIGMHSSSYIIKTTLIACIIGALLISLVYIGFMFSAASHAEALKNIPTEALIGKLSILVLGKYGSLFVSICVFFACLATGIALTEVSSNYFHRFVFQEKIPRIICLSLSLLIMSFMSILGFASIMKIAFPILKTLYPLLILFCIINIIIKLRKKKNYLKEN